MRNGWISWRFGDRVASLLGFGDRPDAIHTRGMTLGSAADELGISLATHAQAIIEEFVDKTHESLARNLQLSDYHETIISAMSLMHSDLNIVTTRHGESFFRRVKYGSYLRLAIHYRGIYVMHTDIALAEWSPRYTRDFEREACRKIYTLYQRGQRTVSENLEAFDGRAAELRSF